MEIFKSEDDKINRLFRFNSKNEYTTIDLRNADFLGFETNRFRWLDLFILSEDSFFNW